MKKYFTFGACAIVISGAFYWSSRPSTYDECIIKNMHKVENEQAANYIMAACRAKFPKEKIYLSESEVYGEKQTTP